MKRLLLTSLCVLFASTVVLADWDPGDPFKMDYPQLPDPDGWDVNFVNPKVLADDWLCTQTGPVSDIHFWMSSRKDEPFHLLNIHVSIHTDDVTGPFSKPGDLLWQRDFQPPLFTVRDYGTGIQGWLDPNPVPPVVEPNDHLKFYQVNIEDIFDPFPQKEGTVYWLDLTVFGLGLTGVPAQLGWKTSLNHFRDDAVWADFGSAAVWQPLSDPFTGETLDLAFVITPEPGTLCLLALGGLALLRRKRA